MRKLFYSANAKLEDIRNVDGENKKRFGLIYNNSIVWRKIKMSYQDINAATIDRWIKEEDWEWGRAISHEEYIKALNGELGCKTLHQ